MRQGVYSRLALNNPAAALTGTLQPGSLRVEPWQCLYRLPEPQGHRAFLLIGLFVSLPPDVGSRITDPESLLTRCSSLAVNESSQAIAGAMSTSGLALGGAGRPWAP
jgi:hypothetical protein